MIFVILVEAVFVGRNKYDKADIGKCFGKWVVEGYSHYDNEHYWKVLCTSCNKNYTRRASQLVNGRSHGCQSCNSVEREKYSFWEGIDGVSKQYLTRLHHRNKEVQISLQDLVDRWKLQNGKCAYTGLKLILVEKDTAWKQSTASIDRIDSSKGYILGNIQWVHKRVNTMKNDMSEDEFLLWCHTIVKECNGGSCGV